MSVRIPAYRAYGDGHAVAVDGHVYVIQVFVIHLYAGFLQNGYQLYSCQQDIRDVSPVED